MTARTKVVLIGGTSHVGKSTLSRDFAERTGWRKLSTDDFARHPGRPWRDDDSAVPVDVRSHFKSLTTTELLDSVLAHYRSNVMPIAKAVVDSHLNNAFDPCLVLEGSALLPMEISSFDPDEVISIWLTAPADTLRARIYSESRFHHRVLEDQALIDRFCDRTIAYSGWLDETTKACGFTLADVTSSAAMATLESLLEESFRNGDPYAA